jgi:hypothetical protein
VLSIIFQASGTDALGVVVGGSSIEQRKLCATEVSKRNVSGYLVYIIHYCLFFSSRTSYLPCPVNIITGFRISAIFHDLECFPIVGL